MFDDPRATNDRRSFSVAACNFLSSSRCWWVSWVIGERTFPSAESRSRRVAARASFDIGQITSVTDFVKRFLRDDLNLVGFARDTRRGHVARPLLERRAAHPDFEYGAGGLLPGVPLECLDMALTFEAPAYAVGGDYQSHA